MIAVRVVMDLLVRGEYAAVESIRRGRRLSAGELQSAVETYGRRLIHLPGAERPLLEVVEIAGSEPAAAYDVQVVGLDSL
jgi:hypothetical protein